MKYKAKIAGALMLGALVGQTEAKPFQQYTLSQILNQGKSITRQEFIAGDADSDIYLLREGSLEKIRLQKFPWKLGDLELGLTAQEVNREGQAGITVRYKRKGKRFTKGDVRVFRDVKDAYIFTDGERDFADVLLIKKEGGPLLTRVGYDRKVGELKDAVILIGYEAMTLDGKLQYHGPRIKVGVKF